MEKSRKNLIVLAVIMGIIWLLLLLSQIHLTDRVFYGYKQIFQNKLDLAVNQSLKELDSRVFNVYFHKDEFRDWYYRQESLHRDPEFGVETSLIADYFFSEKVWSKIMLFLDYSKASHSFYDYQLIQYDIIDSLVSTSLHDNFIYEPFSMGIYCNSRKEFYCLTEGVNQDNLLQKGFKYSLLCISDQGNINSDDLYLFFPNLEYRFQWDIAIAYLVIVLLLLILLYCFTVFIVIVIRLRKVNEFRVDMLHNITHELKTPVTTINLASQLLQDKSIQKDEKSSEEYLKIISEETSSLMDLIDEVLTVFRSEKMLAKEYVDVEVHSLIKSVVAIYQLRLNQCNAVVNFDFQAEKDLVAGVYIHLSNAFSNLIDNAIKYRNGDLVIDISTRNVGNYIEICFKDNGIGIDKANQQLIFEPFSRVNTQDGHYVKGYGLGLNYVNQIMVYHKGTIKVESELGKGANFIVSLPLKTK